MKSQRDDSWHGGCIRPGMAPSPDPTSFRRRNMRIVAAMVALAFTVGSASASQLDFQPGALGTGGSQFKHTGPQSTLLTNGPIRHRRPYRGHDYGYGYRGPEYFATLGAGRFDPSDQPGTGLYVNGSVGSVFADQLDLGIQLSWYHRSTGGEEFVRQGDLPDGTHVTTVVRTRSIDTNLVPLMGTLRVRIPVTPQFEPYVGGGLGWEWLTIEGTDENGVDFRNDYDGFGAQVFTGANLNLARQTSLYGEAVWNASTPKAEFFDPSIGQTVREEADFDGIAFHGGLRFMF
ncbi:MAG: porin family protein [Candidatus Eisenbacteria bacterium]|uniref:Porin family protein n=1 Tax=Eiseniibacteriota bacterium TaxID=2212470 RepID=A0A538TAN4_UNCEI|nr:MAG: porin family protein [Candidatus Eisenbacteria bacterium]